MKSDIKTARRSRAESRTQVQHIHISAKQNLLDLHLKEVWQYRGLIWLFTRRSFVVSYTQTILGPLWLVITPLMTSLIHVVIFGNIAKLGTDGVPQLLFYLTGNALWGYFSSCVTKCSATFTGNAGLFGKVYFPRLVVPLSDVLGNALRFCIQMLPALVLLIYYVIHGMLHPRLSAILIVPVLLLLLGMMGMGLGIIISSLTTKYRDLSVLVGFGISLWMYATPVVYPLSTLSGTIRKFVLLNPVSLPMELFRWAVLGVGNVSPSHLAYSLWVTVMLVFGGIVVFNRVERTFLDTV